IYRMDYAAMLKQHRDSGAEATVACLTVTVEEAKSFGVMTVDADGRIGSFLEKPEHPPSTPGDPGHVLASMGVYVFPVKLLVDLLRRDNASPDSTHDFG